MSDDNTVGPELLCQGCLKSRIVHIGVLFTWWLQLVTGDPQVLTDRSESNNKVGNQQAVVSRHPGG
jgi:hypothetical protein